MSEQAPKQLVFRRTHASWAKPSLSRDFALLAVAIVIIMLVISTWVTWVTYLKHSERVFADLQTETDRIERILDAQIKSADYLLTSMGRQLSEADTRNLGAVAHLLQTYAVGNPKYALWSWANASAHIVASSNKGVLAEPVDVSDRDYIRQAQLEPWVPHIGTPIEGRVSGRWIIPVGLGVADGTGHYLGALSVSLDIGSITEQIQQLIQRDGISFAIFSKALVPLTSAGVTPNLPADKLPIANLEGIDLTHQPRGVLSRAPLFGGEELYAYYLASERYPYLIVVGYEPEASNSAIRGLLWPRLVQLGAVSVFLLALLWLIRTRVIAPVVELGAIAESVSSGKPFRPLSISVPLELEYMALQVQRAAEHIAERRRIEEELRDKLAAMQHKGENMQGEMRQRSALLAGALREYKQSLRSINTAAQAMKDQTHGPIQPPRYRELASDIHQTGTSLELMVRKLIALSRVDAVAVLPKSEKVDLAQLVEAAVQFAAEGASGPLPEIHYMPLPASVILRADATYLRQGLAYALLYSAGERGGDKPITVRYHTIRPPRSDEMRLLLIGREGPIPPDAAWISAFSKSPAAAAPVSEDETAAHLHASLARAIFRMQHMTLAIVQDDTCGTWLAVRIPDENVMPEDEDAEA